MRIHRPAPRASIRAQSKRWTAPIAPCLSVKLCLALCLALSFAGCNAELGSISGTIHVGSVAPGVRVVAQLYGLTTDARGNVSLHIADQYSVGLTGITDTFDYSFLSVKAGRYLVGAFVDSDGDGYLHPCEPYTINEFQELAVEPADTLHHDQDVHLSRSAPGTATVRGTVHVGGRALERELTVSLMDGPMNKAGSRLVAIRSVCGTGEARPFTFFNVPEGRLDLVAFAYPNGEDDFSLYGMLPTNPIRVDLAKTDLVEGLSVWLDAQAPELGSISGAVHFSAPAHEAVVQVMSYDRDPADPDARLTAIEMLRPEPGAESVAFTLRSLALRPHYVAAYVEVVDSDGTAHATARVHQHDRSPAGVALTAGAPHGSVSLSLGLGRVSGDIALTNARPTLKSVFVLATVDGDVVAWDEFAGSVVDGVFTTSADHYTLFGLDDGDYQMVLVPDISGDGRPEDEIAARWTFGAEPAEVSISGGARVGADFLLRLPD